MLVRFKKHGEFPPPSHWNSGDVVSVGGVRVVELWRGRIIEVEGDGCNEVCGGRSYTITDARWYDMAPEVLAGTCEHFLIDDLNAYDSDSEDSQAEVGDLAMAEVRQSQAVKL